MEHNSLDPTVKGMKLTLTKNILLTFYKIDEITHLSLGTLL
jgi:hypothetical protein